MRRDDTRKAAASMPRMGRDEINLTEFPLSLLTDRSPEDKAMVRRYVDGERVWEIIGDGEHGFPTRLEHEVYVVLMQISYEQGFPERALFSRYDLLRRLGWGAGGLAGGHADDGGSGQGESK